jgi:hypothetical protein
MSNGSPVRIRVAMRAWTLTRSSGWTMSKRIPRVGTIDRGSIPKTR